MTERTNKLPERCLLARAALAILALPLVLAVGYADRAEGAGRSTEVDREDAVEPSAGDVFVVVDGRLRNPTFETPDDAQLFNDAGTQIGVTWGRWKAASATAKVRIGGNAPSRTRTSGSS